ncbi:MAG TPA: helix-turn-helix domain-containing protein [Patescibacteria group bacterium]
MVDFTNKKISDNETLGEVLRRQREELGFQLDYVSREINVQQEHLLNLEDSDYQALPAPVYTRNFVELYSRFLGLVAVKMIQKYNQEVNIFDKTAKTPQKYNQPPTRLAITPRFFKSVIVGLIAAVCLVYIGFQVDTIVQPPELVIAAPNDNLVTDQLSVVIDGRTEKEVKVTINGQEVLPRADGSFQENLSLKPGINLIEISAAKKYSKIKTVYRQVLVEPKSAGQ